MCKGELADGDVTLLDGLPVTTALRTIRDLLDRRTDASHVATIIRQAVEAGQVAADELPGAIAPYARRYGAPAHDGSALLAHLLAQIGVPPQPRDEPVTWGQLANPSTELVRLLRRAGER